MRKFMKIQLIENQGITPPENMCENSCFLHFIFCNFVMTKAHWLAHRYPMVNYTKTHLIN